MVTRLEDSSSEAGLDSSCSFSCAHAAFDIVSTYRLSIEQGHLLAEATTGAVHPGTRGVERVDMLCLKY